MAKLNCQPGDLAVIVSSPIGNVGALVECITLFADYVGRSGGDPVPTWGVRSMSSLLMLPITWTPGDSAWCRARGFHTLLRDADLRPLRDTDGDDETLAWAGSPTAVDGA